MNMAEAVAKCFYEALQRQIFGRVTYATTSMAPAKWKDLPARDRFEFIEAARTVLADKEIMQSLMNRAQGF